MPTDYPEQCIKGIPNENYLFENEIVLAELFSFQDRGQRNDGWIEESINWDDDEKVVSFTLMQVKNGESHFKGGVALIKTEELERLKRRLPYKDRISYERQELIDNKYHGNLLMQNTLPKNVKRAIAGHLATLCQLVRREEVEVGPG